MHKKCIAQNFIFFEIFTIYLFYAHQENQNQEEEYIFRGKIPMQLILHIMNTNILFGYTDTVLGRRYAIGILSEYLTSISFWT